jgi:hypothetical protein
MKEGQGAAEFEAELDKWSGCYIVCKVGGDDDDEEEVKHGIDACPKKGSGMWELFVEKVKDIKEGMFKKKRFKSFPACFGCGLP